jgi:hypothetical protein
MTFAPWDIAAILCALVAGGVIIVQRIKRMELEKEIRDHKSAG